MISIIKKNNKLTIILPIFDEPEVIVKFINYNKELLETYPVFVLNKKGGEPLKEHSSFYLKTNCPTIAWPLGGSRKFLLKRVQTEFTLNMDVDVLLPPSFIKEALNQLKDPKVGAVVLDYEEPLGHAPFGPSLWRTNILKKLYDWDSWRHHCECVHMWNKLQNENYKIIALDLKAGHIKSIGDSIRQQNHNPFDRVVQIGRKPIIKTLRFISSKF